MAKVKNTLSPYEALHEEVLVVAAELAAARAALAATALEVAEHKNDSKDWAPDLAAPTAVYTLAYARYDAIRDLFAVAGRNNREELLEFGPYARARAAYDVAYA
jgi:hypothetical protein